jgi:hypothetical protein
MQDHLTAFGQNCLDCHDGADRMVNFDHTATGFSLEGQHASLRCTDCHLNGQFKNTPSSCQGCHREPDAHRGLFAQTCADCHTSAAWSPAHFNGQLFSHDTSTPFSLVKHSQDYAGAPITCKSCHTSSTFQFEAQTCIDCHGGYDANFMTSHRAEFGDNCIDCHDGSDRLANFDHSTFFVLDGKHAEIGCTDCHQNHVFKGTPADCSSCHTEPDIHKGFFGLQCQDCHTTSAWHPARLLSHAFPLDHGGSTVECQTCHPTTYDQYTCYGCHEHQEAEILGKHLEEGISQIELPECVRCHPTGREHD